MRVDNDDVASISFDYRDSVNVQLYPLDRKFKLAAKLH